MLTAQNKFLPAGRMMKTADYTDERGIDAASASAHTRSHHANGLRRSVQTGQRIGCRFPGKPEIPAEMRIVERAAK